MALSDLANSLTNAWECSETSGVRFNYKGTLTLGSSTTNVGTINSVNGVYPIGATTSKFYQQFLWLPSNYLDFSTSTAVWVETWVKPTDSTSGHIIGDGSVFYISKAGTTNIPTLQLVETPSGFSRSVGATTSLTPNQWNQIVAVWRGSDKSFSIYVNTTRTNAGTTVSAIKSPISSDRWSYGADAGQFANSAWGNWVLGPLRVGTNYEPTDADITSLYNSGAGRTLSALQQRTSIVRVLATSTIGGANTATLALDSTGANFAVVGASSYAAGVGGGIIDSLGNTWTPSTSYLNSTSKVQFFYSSLTTTGQQTITFAGTGIYPALAYSSYYGNNIQYEEVNGSGSTATAGNLSPNTNGSVVVALLGLGTSHSNPSLTGMSVRDQRQYTGGTNMGLIFAETIQTTSAVINPTFTITGGSNRASIGMVLREGTTTSGGGGGGTIVADLGDFLCFFAT